MRLSIIVPVLDEVAGIAQALDALSPFRDRGHEVIVVDGGSADATLARAEGRADAILVAPRGRASQMNAGAAAATGDAFLFLHADTRLPEGAADMILGALRSAAWGRFDVRIESTHPFLRVVAFMMNLRSRVTGIATGDQAIFVARTAFANAGGFPDIALMEDVALSVRLKRAGPPACLRAKVATSGRRWEKLGVFRTILLMWQLRLRYFCGADPARLARLYAGKS